MAVVVMGKQLVKNKKLLAFIYLLEVYGQNLYSSTTFKFFIEFFFVYFLYIFSNVFAHHHHHHHHQHPP